MSSIAAAGASVWARLQSTSLIYGQFLQHINHSAEHGLFAEQIRGGFEGEDVNTYRESFADRSRVEIANIKFKGGNKRRDSGGPVLHDTKLGL